MTSDIIEANLARFKQALEDNSLTDQLLTRKFIIHGSPYFFIDKEELYFDLKYEISKHFSIHPEDVRMVGSAKLGFSIAPRKLWTHFSEESDIDVVIVSEAIFNSFWRKLYDFNIALTNRTEKEVKRYEKFLEYFFKGWIRPDYFPFNFSGKNEWFDYFKSISYGKYGNQKITCAIYHNFDLFEKYHMKNIQEIRIGGRQNA